MAKIMNVAGPLHRDENALKTSQFIKRQGQTANLKNDQHEQWYQSPRHEGKVQ